MKKLFLLLALGAAQPLFAQTKTELMKVTDMLKITQLTGVTISPDGSKAAFVATRIEPDADNKWEADYMNQIYIVPVDGSSAPRQLTARETASQPAWGPDGKQLAFIRTVDGKPQIFLLSLDGGEPVQLTKFKYGAGSPKWSSDGKKILFSTSIPLQALLKDSVLNSKKEIPKWPYEKPGFEHNSQLQTQTAKPDPDGNLEEIRAYLENNANDKKAKVITKLNFQEEKTTSSEISFNHFFIVNVEPGSQPVAVTHGFYRFTAAEFTPDGKQLLITGDMDDTQHPDRSLESEIFLADADGSNLKLLLGEEGKTYTSARISPSGKWLAFQYGNTSFVDVPALAIMPVNGSNKDMITIPFDRSKGNITWSADEKYLYFAAQSNGGAPVYRADMTTKKVEALSDVNAGISSFDIKNNNIVFVKTEVANPFELYVSDATLKNTKRISSFNYNWIKNKKLSYPEKKSFVNEKGLTIEYWVMKPTNFEPGKKYPAILNIHGGPSAMWGPGESSMWHEFQYYAAMGYVVVYGNPRGSGGYGAAFLRANMNDWGTGPTADVLTALDKAGAEGFIDTARLTVTGGSYAGYLVAWIISQDQRFKAACSQRGVYDLGTFFGEGNAWRLVPNYFGGYPWEPATKAIIQRESPITYVQNIHTPYIIFHGENDLRTGVIQSEMLYRSLKVLGRNVEYVRHPGATHELTRSGNNRQRIDQMLRTIEFFERFIKH
ncbi:MAG: S9 family peptidase [Sediminibacterium sp.]|nr:S9 family peptidase [Sediminibacterium sp.]MDP1811205.1 S9 family peptidase [Sediminibacterium sp.]MDP3128705.1 S9 family peptidase [Sediminibacterium sp.]MDP3666647.1 S9 family peptidase [Sediminibacterium sp.]